MAVDFGLIAFTVLVFLAAFFLHRRLRRRALIQDGAESKEPFTRDPEESLPRHLSADISTRLQELISRRELISAIKLLREHSGMGLKEAKDYIDFLMAGGRMRSGSITLDRAAAKSPPADLDARVRALLVEDRKIEAIKLARNRMGWGLVESKEYVDRTERDMKSGG